MFHRKILRKLGERIVFLRKELKLSQKQLAFEADIGLRTLRRIEKGEDNPTAETMLSIARALNVHPAVLWNFEIEESEFMEIWTSECPFKHNEHCRFLPNQNGE